MATLTSAYSPRQSYLASILTGNPNRVTVEVEDDIDARFWADLLRERCPEKDFHFNPYQTIVKGKDIIEVKGKARIMKMASELNNNHIGCVDSDNDWLLSDYTEDGETISKNKYLLQTYAYSIENLMCCPETLADVCKDSVQESTDYDFTDYMKRLSCALYHLVVWSLYLTSIGKDDFTPSAWRKVLVADFSKTDDPVGLVKERTQLSVNELTEKYEKNITEKDNFEQMLANTKQLTVDNAYLYVRGHELEDHLLNAILVPITRHLYNEHISTIKAGSENSDQKGKKILYYQNYVQPVKSVLKRNYRYKSYSNLYNKICSDIIAIW